MSAALTIHPVPEAFPRRAGLAVGVFFLLSLLPAVAAASIDHGDLTPEVVLAWLVVLYCAFRIAIHAGDGRMRLLTLTFWVYTYVWMALAPMLQVLASRYPEEGSYSPHLVVVGFFIIILGIFAYELGLIIGSADSDIWDRISRRLLLERYVNPTRAIELGLMALLASSVIIIALGGPEVLVQPRAVFFQRLGEEAGENGLTSTNQAITRLLYTALRVAPFVALFGLVVLWISNRRNGKSTSRLAVGLALMLGVINLLVSNPIASPRSWFGTILFSFIFFYYPWMKRKTFALWAVGFILALVVIFPYADVFRNTLSPDATIDFRLSGLSDQLINKLDYGAFQQMLNTEQYVEKYGSSAGGQFAGAALFWVPRRFWANKPLPSGIVIADFKGYMFVGLSLDLWSEAYLNGGLACVAGLFLVYGVVTGVLEKAYLRGMGGEANVTTILVPILAAQQFVVLRGDFFTAMVYNVPLIVLCFFLSKRDAGRKGLRVSLPTHQS